MPVISVVIPLFNKKLYISRCLESVGRQTMRDFEVVVVDDGSTDGSGEAAAAFADPRIRVIRQENCGVSAARNRGIRESRGELIAFLDADDEWMPTFLEGILDLRREYPKAGIFATGFRRCRGREFDTEITIVPPASGYRLLIPNYLQTAMHGNFVTSSSVAVPRTVLCDVGGFPEGEQFGEDRDLWVRIALKYPTAYDVRILAIYHSEAEGRACDGRPTSRPFPPAVNTLRLALEEGRVPSDEVQDVQAYIDLLRIQYAHWQISLRDRTNAMSFLGEQYFTRRFRIQAVFFRWLVRLLPLRLVEAIRLKPQNAMLRLRQIQRSGSAHTSGDVRRHGDLLIRQIQTTPSERDS